jgi:fatty-acyl-CoA synthase
MTHTEAHSSVRGIGNSPPSDLIIAALLAETAARFRLAVVFRERSVRWSWKQFASEIEAFAAATARLQNPGRIQWAI